MNLFTAIATAARAHLLRQIAEDAAALTIQRYPKATFEQSLGFVVQAMSSAAGLPTRNGAALERAAAGALIRYGKQPDAPTR